VVNSISGGKTIFEAFYFNIDFTLKDRGFFKNPYSKIGGIILRDGAIKKINF